MIIELKKRRNFPSLGMGKTAAYDVKCDVTELKPTQFSVPRVFVHEEKKRRGERIVLRQEQMFSMPPGRDMPCPHHPV